MTIKTRLKQLEKGIRGDNERDCNPLIFMPRNPTRQDYKRIGEQIRGCGDRVFIILPEKDIDHDGQV